MGCSQEVAVTACAVQSGLVVKGFAPPDLTAKATMLNGNAEKLLLLLMTLYSVLGPSGLSWTTFGSPNPPCAKALTAAMEIVKRYAIIDRTFLFTNGENKKDHTPVFVKRLE